MLQSHSLLQAAQVVTDWGMLSGITVAVYACCWSYSVLQTHLLWLDPALLIVIAAADTRLSVCWTADYRRDRLGPSHSFMYQAVTPTMDTIPLTCRGKSCRCCLTDYCWHLLVLSIYLKTLIVSRSNFCYCHDTIYKWFGTFLKNKNNTCRINTISTVSSVKSFIWEVFHILWNQIYAAYSIIFIEVNNAYCFILTWRL